MSNISPCDMEDESRECTHWWRIKQYSDILQERGEKLRSEKFSATDDDFYWCLEHKIYMKNLNEIYVSINLRPDCYDDLRKCESVSGNVHICILSHADFGPYKYKNPMQRKHSFTLSYDEQNRNFNVGEYSMDIIKYLPGNQNALDIICKITYRKKNETVTILDSTLSSDMERCFTEDRFKDVTISVKGKEYRAHKNILATRSTVFDKMLSVDMLESKENHIDITDVDHEPFEEMLHYIYTGKVKNLDESAFELLPLADKYDLKELRSMCGEVLVKKLTTDNAAKVLILADMHRAEKLKTHTLRFINENYESCEEFNDTEFWKNLASSGNAQLLKEMMAAFCKRQQLG